jgi:hypothetical protein
MVAALGDRGSRVQISPLRTIFRSFFKDCAGHDIALPFAVSGTDQQQTANKWNKDSRKSPELPASLRASLFVRRSRRKTAA